MTSTHPQKSDEAPGTSLKGACHCGACGWTLHGDPGSITACNCSLCVRIGALWAYDFEDERISITGPTSAYARKNKTDPALEIHFCPTCSNVVCSDLTGAKSGSDPAVATMLEQLGFGR